MPKRLIDRIDVSDAVSQRLSKISEIKKPDFAVDDRFTKQIFQELGWGNDLDYGVVETKINDIFNVAQIQNAISDTLSQIQIPEFDVTSKIGFEDEVIRKTQEQFGSYFTENLQNRIGIEVPKTLKQQWQTQNPAKNIKPNRNPLDLVSSDAIAATLSFAQQNDNSQKIEEYKQSVLKILNLLYDFWLQVEQNLSAANSFLNDPNLIPLLNDAEKTSSLRREVLRLSNLYPDIERNSTFHYQCLEVKASLDNLYSIYRPISQTKEIATLETFIEQTESAKEFLQEIISENKQTLLAIEGNIFGLSPRKITRSDIPSYRYTISEVLFLDEDAFSFLFEKFYKNSRNDYKISGHSSVNMSSTDFIKSVKTQSDVFAEIDESFPTDNKIAPKFEGAGVLIAANDSIETVELDKKIGPIWEQNFDTLLEQVAQGKSYSTVTNFGKIGKYGFSAKDLNDFGYVHSVNRNQKLAQDAVWLGKDGISTRDQFLANQAVQDKLIELRLRVTYSRLLNNGIVKKDSPISYVGAAIGTAYLYGMSAMKKLEIGAPMASGGGSDALTTFNQIKSALSDDLPENDITKSILNSGGDTSDALVALSGSAHIPDSQTFQIPVAGAAPQYPHNHVQETESGHFFEKDDTPGAERIQERHRTGTGYEILPNGTQKNVIVADRYTAIFGDDYISVSGNVNVHVSGDASLNVSGDLDLATGNDLNMTIGGDMNVSVAGDKSFFIEGSSSESSNGDMSINSNGYMSVASEGDMQLQGASVTLISRVSDIALVSVQKITSIAQEISILGKGLLNLGSSGDVSLKGSNFLVNASQFLARTSTTSIAGSGINLYTSEVNATVKEAQKAKAISPSLSGTSGSVPTTSNFDNMDILFNSSDFEKALEEFEAFDIETTQSSGFEDGVQPQYQNNDFLNWIT